MPSSPNPNPTTSSVKLTEVERQVLQQWLEHRLDLPASVPLDHNADEILRDILEKIRR